MIVPNGTGPEAVRRVGLPLYRPRKPLLSRAAASPVGAGHFFPVSGAGPTAFRTRKAARRTGFGMLSPLNCLYSSSERGRFVAVRLSAQSRHARAATGKTGGLVCA